MRAPCRRPRSVAARVLLLGMLASAPPSSGTKCEWAFLGPSSPMRRNRRVALSSEPDVSVPNSDDGALALSDALALKRQAEVLRAEASAMERAVKESKLEALRKEAELTDQWIDRLLVNFTVDDSTQMLNTEERVAQLLQEGRFTADHVNKIFDRICRLSQRRQSIESCSPLISLLLDAACKVDCIEREDNPNKRWNGRVERDLRKRLFAMGWGIELEDIKRKDEVRALTGERDYT